MSNKEKESQIENINKSIHSEKLKALNLTKSTIVTKKRSNSVSNNSKRRTKHIHEDKKEVDNPFNINLKDIIKEASLQQKEMPKEIRKNPAQSKESTQTQLTTKVNKERPRNPQVEADSYLLNATKMQQSEENSKKKVNRKIKDKNGIESNSAIKANSNLTQDNFKSNPDAHSRGRMSDWNSICLSDVFKSQSMSGNQLDYMMIFKNRLRTPLIGNKPTNHPILILDQKTDQSPCKIEITLLPRNSRNTRGRNREDNGKRKIKAFLPQNIGESFITRKNNILQSILGLKEFDKLFKYNHQCDIPINETEEYKGKQVRESFLSNKENDINISDIDSPQVQRNKNELAVNLTEAFVSSKKNSTYFEKYHLIESKL